MMLMKVSNTGFRASSSFGGYNVVTVLIFVKVFMHSAIMIYVRSPDLIEKLDSVDSADY